MGWQNSKIGKKPYLTTHQGEMGGGIIKKNQILRCSLANTLVGVANRIGKGHYGKEIGAVWAAGRLIPLQPLIQKNPTEEINDTKSPKLKLRPIVIGDTIRRLW